MKKVSMLFTSITGVVLLALATPTFAADKDEVTLSGTAKCAKCALKETAKCQTVIEAEKDGKPVKYYVANNDVAKKFHENVCQDSKKVTATGTVKEKDGKQEFTATKIEVEK